MITIGIPAYNEGKSIGLAIQSILHQIGDTDEIIAVCSNCTDNTVEVLKSFKDSRIIIIEEKERNGKASAINIINKRAKGKVIIQFDADVVLESDAINRLLESFSDSEVGAVSGNPIPKISKGNVFHDFTIMSYRKLHEERLKQDKKGTFWHLSGYLLAWRKGALPKVPFAKGAVDAWMGKLIREGGWKLKYAPKAFVYVKAPENTQDFIAQKARVRAGYYFLPKDDMPRTIKKELLWLPKEFFKVPFWRWHKFIYSGFVYAYSWKKGKDMAKNNNSLEEIWKVPKSTK